MTTDSLAHAPVIVAGGLDRRHAGRRGAGRHPRHRPDERPHLPARNGRRPVRSEGLRPQRPSGRIDPAAADRRCGRDRRPGRRLGAVRREDLFKAALLRPLGRGLGQGHADQDGADQPHFLRRRPGDAGVRHLQGRDQNPHQSDQPQGGEAGRQEPGAAVGLRRIRHQPDSPLRRLPDAAVPGRGRRLRHRQHPRRRGIRRTLAPGGLSPAKAERVRRLRRQRPVSDRQALYVARPSWR